MLRRIFRPKKEEVTKVSERHNGSHNLYSFSKCN